MQVQYNRYGKSIFRGEPRPICLPCGMTMMTLHQSPRIAPSNPGVFFRETHWNRHKKTRQSHVMVPSSEVEEACFSKYSELWACTARAIFRGRGAKYRLSGINVINHATTRPYNFPINPGTARIGGCNRGPKYNKDSFVQTCARDVTSNNYYEGGIFVHTQCWALFNQVIDTKLIERKLDKFIHAARRYWFRNLKRWGIHKHRDWSVIWDTKFPNYSQTSFFGYDISLNPLILLEVQKTIDRARNVQEDLVPSCSSKVPLDVAIIIAELVCPGNYTPSDVENTRRMISAFQWRLPDWFWQKRLEKHSFLELDNLRKANPPIGWQTLWLGLTDLLFDKERYISSGLANRERVLKVMTAIKSNFLESC